MINKIRWFIVRLIKPISEIIGKLHYAPHDRLLRASMIKDMLDLIRSGDVIVAYSRGELTNPFIDGDFKHAAMYVGEGNIIQAIGKGVELEGFEDFCASKDRIAILRPLFCDTSTAKIAAKAAKSQIDKPYDYYFEIGEQSFYCAELIEWAYKFATHGASTFVRKDILGVNTVLPSDFYNAKSKFQLVIERPNNDN